MGIVGWNARSRAEMQVEHCIRCNSCIIRSYYVNDRTLPLSFFWLTVGFYYFGFRNLDYRSYHLAFTIDWLTTWIKISPVRTCVLGQRLRKFCFYSIAAQIGSGWLLKFNVITFSWRFDQFFQRREPNCGKMSCLAVVNNLSKRIETRMTSII